MAVQALAAIALVWAGYRRPQLGTALAAACLPIIWAGVNGSLDGQTNDGFDD